MLVIQAIKALGPEHISKDIINQLAEKTSPAEKREATNRSKAYYELDLRSNKEDL